MKQKQLKQLIFAIICLAIPFVMVYCLAIYYERKPLPPHVVAKVRTLDDMREIAVLRKSFRKIACQKTGANKDRRLMMLVNLRKARVENVDAFLKDMSEDYHAEDKRWVIVPAGYQPKDENDPQIKTPDPELFAQIEIGEPETNE